MRQLTEAQRILLEKMPPPASPDRVSGSLLHPDFGRSLELPEDYLWFMNTYGPGWFDTGGPAYFVADLLSGEDERSHEFYLDIQGYHAFEPEACPAAFPEMPGLLAWGSFYSGDWFCWWVEGQPEQWRVVMANPRRGPVEFTPCSMVEFIVASVLHVPQHGKVWFPGDEFTGFRPRSRYLDAFKA